MLCGYKVMLLKNIFGGIRNTYYYCFMKAKTKEPRKPRSYKATDKNYNKAMRRAKKEGGKLSGLLENVVIGYANGLDVRLASNNPDIV